MVVELSDGLAKNYSLEEMLRKLCQKDYVTKFVVKKDKYVILEDNKKEQYAYLATKKGYTRQYKL